MHKVNKTPEILKSIYLIIHLEKLRSGDKARKIVGDQSISGLISGLLNPTSVVFLFNSLSLPLSDELTSYLTAT